MVANRNIVLQHLGENVAWFGKMVSSDDLLDDNLPTAKPPSKPKQSKSQKSKDGKKNESPKDQKPPIYWTLLKVKESLSTTLNRIYKKSEKGSLFSIEITCAE